MATTKNPVTFEAPAEEAQSDEPRVRIILPELEDAGEGVLVDQYEHVSISNENGDNFIRIKRGEYVDVTVPVFNLLKQRYPKL